MNIFIIGYGKMGKAIEEMALARGHKVLHKVSLENTDEWNRIQWDQLDVAIEFTHPDSAAQCIKSCIENGVPVISGTTGWLQQKSEIVKLCEQRDGTFFYASNFSIGVNIIFKINELLASMLRPYANNYRIGIEETHHMEKQDAPSGTAITLAEGIMDHIKSKKSWVNHSTEKPEELQIISHRINQIPGTHVITYNSEIEDIQITHKAHSRIGFAQGAVTVAEWILGKKGVLNMNDFLNH